MTDLNGIAAIITAVTGLVSVVLTAYVLLRVNHVVRLTNSNFSAMQATLDTALQTGADERKDAIKAAVDAKPPAEQQREQKED